MFFPRSKPLEVAPAHVRGLRLSLNTPVVSTEDLPVGPARAAILIHEEPGGGATVTIGIRSLRADRFALYGIDPEVGGDTTFDVAVDAALSFAESMGFLFDEDELGEGGAPERMRCLGLWRDLLGESGARLPAAEPDELLLEDLAEEATEVAILEAPAGGEEEEPELEFGDVLPPPAELRAADRSGGAAAAPARSDAARADRWDAATSADRSDAAASADRSDAAAADVSDADVAAAALQQVAAGAAARRPKVALSKFRGGPAQPARGAARPASKPAAAGQSGRPGRGTALGRLRLVRRVRDGLRKRNPILRLFGAF